MPSCVPATSCVRVITSLFSGMESIAQYCTDLFGRTRLVNNKGRALDERATLVQYFHERARDKKGEPFEVSYIGYRLSHLKDLKDLYYLKSLCEQETKRGANWNKVFFGSLKVSTEKPPTTDGSS